MDMATVYECSCMSMSQVKDIKFVIYGYAWTIGCEYSYHPIWTFEKKEVCI